MENPAQIYLASKSVAEQICFISQRYVTRDGKYIVSRRDLRNVRVNVGEKENGLDVFPITKEEAQRMIAENGYKMGISNK